MTPIGILAMTLEGDLELAEQCLSDLRDEACKVPIGNNQCAVIAFFPDGPAFEVVDMWDGDERLQ